MSLGQKQSSGSAVRPLAQPAASVYERPFNQAIELIAREIRFTMM
jgi:hypothetical protein